MHINERHPWHVTPSEAIAIQKELASEIIHDTPLDLKNVSLVAGVDVSVKNDVSQAAVVVLSFPELEIVETVLAQQPTSFPYIPGLLTFREGEVLTAAFKKLEHTPDVFIFDGMGRIHPRRMGIAAHMGLWIDRPSIGCGKTHLIGQYDIPLPERGASSPLTDKGELLGVVLRTRDRVKPVYISPGHRIDIASAIKVTLACTSKYRLPDPVRAAHKAAGQYKEI